jgi:hypothetical protein
MGFGKGVGSLFCDGEDVVNEPLQHLIRVFLFSRFIKSDF